ncbi:hypothetical protein B0H12DRAFT_711907 [Mycena haematopus]|nr:hypothetical protein B0H12DRAFT_711907 [Mycena haematopus]
MIEDSRHMQYRESNLVNVIPFPFEVEERDPRLLIRLTPYASSYGVLLGTGLTSCHSPSSLAPGTTMQYSVDSEDFKSSWNLMISLFSETAVSLVLYGIYLAFFLLSVYTLSHRPKAPGIKFLIIASCVMAVLGTIQVATIVAAAAVDARFVQQIVSAEVVNQPAILSTLGRVVSVIFAIDTLIADSLFLYRCYVIWRFEWKVTILPAALMIPTFIVAILWGAPVTPITDVRIAYILGAATNLILTASTAGRILWIHRVASRAGLDNPMRRRVRMAIGIVLESGAIYCIAAVFLAITASQYQTGDSLTIHYVMIGIAGQMLNIIPTFTLVYVGLKNTVDEISVPLESQRTVSSNRVLNEGSGGECASP